MEYVSDLKFALHFTPRKESMDEAKENLHRPGCIRPSSVRSQTLAPNEARTRGVRSNGNLMKQSCFKNTALEHLISYVDRIQIAGISDHPFLSSVYLGIRIPPPF